MTPRRKESGPGQVESPSPTSGGALVNPTALSDGGTKTMLTSGEQLATVAIAICETTTLTVVYLMVMYPYMALLKYPLRPFPDLPRLCLSFQRSSAHGGSAPSVAG
jgi:hypothetical protein